MGASERTTGMQRRTWGRACLQATAAIMVVSTMAASFAFPEEPAGLQGLLPPQIPNGLTGEDFEVLGPNWEPWIEQTSESLLKLYESEQPLDVAGQKAALADLDKRLRVMRKALGDPRYLVIRDSLISLNGRLTRRIELANAILATLSVDPAAIAAAKANAARPALLSSLDSLESYLRTIDGGPIWLDYVKAAQIREGLSAGGDPSAAIPVLEAVSSKLKSRGALEGPQRQFLGRSPFLTLGLAIDRYLSAAALQSPNYQKTLRTHLAALVEAIEKYEEQNLVGDASSIRNALALVRYTAADGGDAIEVVIRTHYLNYNLQALISEDLMAKMVSDEKCQFAPVRDRFMDAVVRGTQTTRTTASFDLKPSDDGANFEIKVNGSTHSNTSGTTDQAVVWSVSNTQWFATKTGHFDGTNFSTMRAQIAANPSVRPIAASTDFDWIPIIGRIARGKAMEEANNRTPAARAHAARRIMEKAGPELDNQVDSSFSDASRDIQTDLLVRLRNAGLYSPVTKILSTEEWMRLSSRVGTAEEPAGAAPEEVIPPGKGITAHIHESLLNNGANRWGFAGRTMTELEVRKELGVYFSQLMKKNVDFMKDYNPKAEGPNTYVFDPQDPVRFQLKNGAVYLNIRAGFKEEGKEDIPPQVVTVELIPRLEGENIVVERGQVSVAPVEKPPAVAVQLIRAGIIKKKIESSFPTRKETRRIELTRTNKPSVYIWVMRIKSLNGWMTVWAE